MRKVIAGCLLALSLTACGGGDGDEASGGVPDCVDVWQDGKTIPTNYEGCMSDPDTLETGTSSGCDSGGEVFTYEPDGNGFFTTASGKIVEAGEDYANDPRYETACED